MEKQIIVHRLDRFTKVILILVVILLGGLLTKPLWESKEVTANPMHTARIYTDEGYKKDLTWKINDDLIEGYQIKWANNKFIILER